MTPEERKAAALNVGAAVNRHIVSIALAAGFDVGLVFKSQEGDCVIYLGSLQPEDAVRAIRSCRTDAGTLESGNPT